ncbi:hypothetical protein V8F20_006181 [Naviculisporaceae sp. PSN 640]
MDSPVDLVDSDTDSGSSTTSGSHTTAREGRFPLDLAKKYPVFARINEILDSLYGIDEFPSHIDMVQVVEELFGANITDLNCKNRWSHPAVSSLVKDLDAAEAHFMYYDRHYRSVIEKWGKLPYLSAERLLAAVCVLGVFPTTIEGSGAWSKLEFLLYEITDEATPRFWKGHKYGDRKWMEEVFDRSTRRHPQPPVPEEITKIDVNAYFNDIPTDWTGIRIGDPGFPFKCEDEVIAIPDAEEDEEGPPNQQVQISFDGDANLHHWMFPYVDTAHKGEYEIAEEVHQMFANQAEKVIADTQLPLARQDLKETVIPSLDSILEKIDAAEANAYSIRDQLLEYVDSHNEAIRQLADHKDALKSLKRKAEEGCELIDIEIAERARKIRDRKILWEWIGDVGVRYSYIYSVMVPFWNTLTREQWKSYPAYVEALQKHTLPDSVGLKDHKLLFSIQYRAREEMGYFDQVDDEMPVFTLADYQGRRDRDHETALEE